MIDRLEISGIRLRLTPEIKKYVNTKIGGLENLLPTHARKSARGRVFLSRPHTKKKHLSVRGRLRATQSNHLWSSVGVNNSGRD